MTSDKKIALITGANKGIGLEIARQLGMRNITVLVGARDTERGRATTEQLINEGIDAHEILIDVTNEVSVKSAAQKIEKQFGHLDILVNNAGISRERGQKPSESSIEYMRETYEANVFSIVTVTNAMLPLLHKSAAGRIVNQSSSMGSLTLASDPQSPFATLNLLAYNSSKAALNSITIEYAKELRGTAIKINASDPGYVSTDLNHHQGYKTPAQGAMAAVKLALLPEDGPSGSFQDENGIVAW